MISKLLDTFAELGLFTGLLYLSDQAWERVFRRRLIYAYAIVRQPVVPARLRQSSGYEVRVFESVDSARSVLEQFETPAQIVQERFQEGYQCLTLQKENALQGYGWLALDEYMEDEVRCRFVPIPAGLTGWDFDVFVLPEFRGTMTFVRLWDAINAHYASIGRQWSMSRISRFNVASMRSHRSMGAEVVASTVFVVIGRLQLMFSSTRPRLHLSASLNSYPTLEVPPP